MTEYEMARILFQVLLLLLALSLSPFDSALVKKTISITNLKCS